MNGQLGWTKTFGVFEVRDTGEHLDMDSVKYRTHPELLPRT